MDDQRRLFGLATVCVAVAAVLLTACRPATGEQSSSSDPIALHVGVPQLPANATNGLRQLAQNQAVESLASVADDGRLRPSLAKDWRVSTDGLTLTVNLRSGVTFHDGTPVTSTIVANSIRQTLPSVMGTAFTDIEDVATAGETQVVVRLRHRSPFLLDALEVPVPKPGAALTGTGPFIVEDQKSPTELKANPKYYLGRPTVDRILVETFPSVRTAWAEMLRGRIDMLYEVGVDELDLLEASTNVAIFTFARAYQYAVVLNQESAGLRSKEVRQALNLSIDRDALVQKVLRGHGTVSFGPVWPHNFAARADWPVFRFDPKLAAQKLAQTSGSRGDPLRFTCLVRPNELDERMSLVLKQQLEAVGIDMNIEEAEMDRIIDSLNHRRFDAVLLESPNGPTLLRSYRSWHSGGPMNAHSETVDTALDAIRYAKSEEEYTKAVGSFQQAAIDDPPAIFLAWVERARAVSKRFIVPLAEPGRDILSTLRLWKPATDQRVANRN
ncbi:MAG: ABC transporter substrate-binding protein [Acidobacteria bacterium]|nr:ABC transporter substrate-binding protein [Acidobacteriota bacterium]